MSEENIEERIRETFKKSKKLNQIENFVNRIYDCLIELGLDDIQIGEYTDVTIIETFNGFHIIFPEAKEFFDISFNTMKCPKRTAIIMQTLYEHGLKPNHIGMYHEDEDGDLFFDDAACDIRYEILDSIKQNSEDSMDDILEGLPVDKMSVQ